jgi:DNA-binding transcriptional LysR family regulator
MRERMDWRTIAFDWNQARAFLVTAEEGSLSAAARALGMAQPTLGRQVCGLESVLGVALFERAGRGLILTPTGAEMVAHRRATWLRDWAGGASRRSAGLPLGERSRTGLSRPHFRPRINSARLVAR